MVHLYTPYTFGQDLNILSNQSIEHNAYKEGLGSNHK